VARLRADGKPVTLTLAGDGEETENLKALIAKLNVGDAVRFIGTSKPVTDFPRQVLVVPSRGDSMPYVVIEAAAAGIPMIAANVGGIPEIFGPTPTASLLPTASAQWPTPSKRHSPTWTRPVNAPVSSGSACLYISPKSHG
jgi:glycosyltransferase involved in cell wall biosynthesis